VLGFHLTERPNFKPASVAVWHARTHVDVSRSATEQGGTPHRGRHRAAERREIQLKLIRCRPEFSAAAADTKARLAEREREREREREKEERRWKVSITATSWQTDEQWAALRVDFTQRGRGGAWRRNNAFFRVYSPVSTWLVTSRLDTIRHVQRVEPMHLGCVELVEQHGSTRSSRHARLDTLDTSNVSSVTWRDEPSGIWAYNVQVHHHLQDQAGDIEQVQEFVFFAAHNQNSQWCDFTHGVTATSFRVRLPPPCWRHTAWTKKRHIFSYTPWLHQIFIKLISLSESGENLYCNRTITKDPVTSQVCRYTTLWNVSVLRQQLKTRRLCNDTLFKEINNRKQHVYCLCYCLK